MIKTGSLPYNMRHTTVSRADFANAGSVNGPEVTSYWSPEQIDAYFKEKYPNLKQPTKSDGTPMGRAFAGFMGERDKQKRRAKAKKLATLEV